MRSSTKDYHRKGNDCEVTIFDTKSTHCAPTASCTCAPITIQSSLSMDVIEELAQDTEAAQ